MALVSAKEMLEKAVAGHYAVPAINLNNLEWTKAVLKGAQEKNSPIIVQVSEGAGKYMSGYKNVADMVNNVMEVQGITVPVALHLDHGSYDGAYKCIEAGFSSIMFDGSHLPIEENLAKTAELAKVCAEKGLSLEAEVGAIGGEEDGVVGAGECADPDECKQIADLGITMLAAGIGNIHGVYPEGWTGLQFDVLEAIKAKIGDMPLVLHGGSGIPEDQIKKAISMGVAKINVNTECQLAFAAATRKYIEEGKARILHPGGVFLIFYVIFMGHFRDISDCPVHLFFPQAWKSGADTMPCFPLLQSPQDPCAAGRQDQGDFSLQDGHEAARIGIVSFLIRTEYDLSLSR